MNSTITVPRHGFRTPATARTTTRPTRSIRARLAAALQRPTGPIHDAVAVPRREQPVPFC